MRYASAGIFVLHKPYFFSVILQGIMLVYDITNEKSFDNIKNWIRNIEEVRNRPNADEDKRFHFIQRVR